MTKTKLVLLVGGACAYASLVSGFSASAQRSSAGVTPACSAQIQQIVWDQPPCVPPTGTGTRPKRLAQVVWDQPPCVPPTGTGTRPKRVEQMVWDQPPCVPPTGTGTRPKGLARAAIMSV